MNYLALSNHHYIHIDEKSIDRINIELRQLHFPGSSFVPVIKLSRAKPAKCVAMLVLKQFIIQFKKNICAVMNLHRTSFGPTGAQHHITKFKERSF